MTPDEVRRAIAAQQQRHEARQGGNGLGLPPGGQPPDHIARRLQAIRDRCAARVAARQAAANPPDDWGKP